MIQKMKQRVPGHREFGTTLHLRNPVILAKARIYGGSRRMMRRFVQFVLKAFSFTMAGFAARRSVDCGGLQSMRGQFFPCPPSSRHPARKCPG